MNDIVAGLFPKKNLELHNPLPIHFLPFNPLSSIFLPFFSPPGVPHPSPNPAMWSAIACKLPRRAGPGRALPLNNVWRILLTLLVTTVTVNLFEAFCQTVNKIFEKKYFRHYVNVVLTLSYGY